MVKEKQNQTKTLVESLTYDPEGPAVQYAWDAKVAGFGVRLYPGGGKSYVIGLRLPGETQMSFPVIDRIKDGWPSPETARKKAKRMLANKESPTKMKRDAKAKKAKQRLDQKCNPTISKLIDKYFSFHEKRQHAAEKSGSGKHLSKASLHQYRITMEKY